MIKQPAWFLIGVLFTYYGYSMLTGAVSWRGVMVPGWVGYAALPIGIICLVGSFFMKKDKPGGEASICPRCGTPFPEELEGTPCPKCGAALENMEGFYERHPEMRSETMQGEYEAQDK